MDNITKPDPYDASAAITLRQLMDLAQLGEYERAAIAAVVADPAIAGCDAKRIISEAYEYCCSQNAKENFWPDDDGLSWKEHRARALAWLAAQIRLLDVFRLLRDLAPASD